MIHLYYAHFPDLDPVETIIWLAIHTHVMLWTVETLLSDLVDCLVLDLLQGNKWIKKKEGKDQPASDASANCRRG